MRGQERLGGDHIPALVFNIQQQWPMAGAATEIVVRDVLLLLTSEDRVLGGMKSSLCQLITCVAHSWCSGREQVTWQHLSYKDGGGSKETADFCYTCSSTAWGQEEDWGEKVVCGWGRIIWGAKEVPPALWWGFDGAMSVWRTEDRSSTQWNKPLVLKGPVACFQLSGLKMGLFACSIQLGLE